MVLPRRPRKSWPTPVTGKLVHVVRHGEAEHNVSDAALKKRNTRLTPRGKRQARALRRLAPKLKSQVVLTSPIHRALQTAKAMKFGLPTVVVPDARERISCTTHLCDIPINSTDGSASKLADQFDWALAKKTYNDWQPQKVLAESDLEDNAGIIKRAQKLTRYILARPEENITIVSHGAFLMRLTSDSYMDNCEVRTYIVTGDKWIRKKSYRLSKNI